MVPVVSTVTCAKIGTSIPAAALASAGPDDGGLGLQQVLSGFDEDAHPRRQQSAQRTAA